MFLFHKKLKFLPLFFLTFSSQVSSLTLCNQASIPEMEETSLVKVINSTHDVTLDDHLSVFIIPKFLLAAHTADSSLPASFFCLQKYPILPVKEESDSNKWRNIPSTSSVAPSQHSLLARSCFYMSVLEWSWILLLFSVWSHKLLAHHPNRTHRWVLYGLQENCSKTWISNFFWRIRRSNKMGSVFLHSNSLLELSTYCLGHFLISSLFSNIWYPACFAHLGYLLKVCKTMNLWPFTSVTLFSSDFIQSHLNALSFLKFPF